ncbi:hypothetical protein KJ611_00240 [Patescibacteria group bacterium]|nr:hypothetical protein [Patescibacteria group bacterium]MBU1705670.1 hypothetical protein [Patescibacteria group bacterium]
MENQSSGGIIWVVAALLVIGGGIYLWQDEGATYQAPESEEFQPVELTQDWQSSDLGFALKLPDGFQISERPDGILVVKESTEAEPEPRPEFQVQVTQGNLADFKVGRGITLLSDEEVIINGAKARKFVITADSLPAGTECDFYSFENRGMIYEFSEYQCVDSPIFEAVLNTFAIVWEK